MNVLTLLMDWLCRFVFARLFTEMNAWAIALFALGVIFCAIEMCTPGVGFFGISGIVLVVAGIVVRMVCGGDVYMLLYMVLFAIVLFVVMFVVASLLIRKSKLGQNCDFRRGYGCSRRQDGRYARLFVSYGTHGQGNIATASGRKSRNRRRVGGRGRARRLYRCRFRRNCCVG